MTQDPIDKKRLPFPMRAAKLSLFIPIVLFAIGLLMLCIPIPKPRELEMAIGAINLILIFGALVLAIIALAYIPRYGRKGILSYACGGIAINLLILASFIFLFFGLKRVAKVFNAGYSLDEMQAMPEVITNSQVITNEEIGFRIEIPKDFIVNPQTQPPNVLYSFVNTFDDANTIVIKIDRLGGTIAKQGLTPEDLTVIRGQFHPGSVVEHTLLKWDRYELDVFTNRFTMNDLRLYMCSVQVPLSREAIQINVAGLEEMSDECNLGLNQLLDSLKGKSNWLSQNSSNQGLQGISLTLGP
ncbi:MAG: hypothetical protein GY845_29060 [Planctomycetes bacterium]|nr:hypothetical protein [Planctomycetota bacterium]